MSFTELAHSMALRMADWWRDREDERLDELASRDYRHLSNAASHSGVTAYQLVSRARSGKDA